LPFDSAFRERASPQQPFSLDFNTIVAFNNSSLLENLMQAVIQITSLSLHPVALFSLLFCLFCAFFPTEH